MIQFLSFGDVQKIPSFKYLPPFRRKSIINILKQKIFTVTGVFIDNKGIFYFESSDLKEYYLYSEKEGKTVQSKNMSLLLNKIGGYGYSVSWCCDSTWKLYRFSMIKSQRSPICVYHRTDSVPDIILKNGLIPNYSFNTCKSHPPLIFVGTEPCWFGKYTYKITVEQQLYIDTNMDWQKRDIRPYLCLREFVEPKLISHI